MRHKKQRFITTLSDLSASAPTTTILIMTITPLRKLFKNNKVCNPFNDAYDFETMIKLIQSTITPTDFAGDPLHTTIRITDFMNTFYTDVYKMLEEDIRNANVSHSQLLDLLFVAFNRNYLVGLKKQIVNAC